MIQKANEEMRDAIHHMWEVCFPNEDAKYTEYYFRERFLPDNCYVYSEQGTPAAAILRNPHEVMFNGRVLACSMLVGIATMPEYREKGYMHALLENVLDACEHSELLTFLQTEKPERYEPYGFRMIYERTQYTLKREDVKKMNNYGIVFNPGAGDLLRTYAGFIRRFNGFYARDLKYFENLRREVSAQGGKIAAYRKNRDEIRGYAVIIPTGPKSAVIQECVYPDTETLLRLVNCALLEYRSVTLLVSKAENLQPLFPHAKTGSYGSTMARLNDPHLFSKLFGKEIRTVQEAYALSTKPLNLNEFD
jgi:predicted acetyltransferase